MTHDPTLKSNDQNYAPFPRRRCSAENARLVDSLKVAHHIANMVSIIIAQNIIRSIQETKVETKNNNLEFRKCCKRRLKFFIDFLGNLNRLFSFIL